MIESILKQLAAIPYDKALHMLGGVVTFAIFNLLFGSAVAACAVVANAIGKEVYDHFHPLIHTCDWKDAAATMIGGIFGFVCTLPQFFNL